MRCTNSTRIDPWFLAQIDELVQIAGETRALGPAALRDRERLYFLKRKGFSDSRLATLTGVTETEVRRQREELDVRPVYKRVDSCAAEFATGTAYLYSTYEEECEAEPSDRAKIMVLGGGPNRIGQGIEFDYCCVHAALALREDGYETIMVNCNPETVSTDFDTSDRLYFEPLTLEDVLEIVRKEQPKGVIVQYGGQTPLKLARPLEANGVPIIGTSPDAIDRAEDRERFQQMIARLGLLQPPNRTAREPEAAVRLAQEIGYPLVVRPSYVLGGRAMEIVHQEEDLRRYMPKRYKSPTIRRCCWTAFSTMRSRWMSMLSATGAEVIIGGIMEHIEEAGVHSGDSACSLPPYSLRPAVQDRLRDQVRAMALELGVIGLMNTQFAIQGDDIYVLEVNPRASRTVPYVSKATGRALAKIAARCMVGRGLRRARGVRRSDSHLLFRQGSGVPLRQIPRRGSPLLGPEMKSTGEVMGVGRTFGEAFAKAQLARATNCRAVDKPSSACATPTSPRRWTWLASWSGSASRWSPPRARPAALRAIGLDCETVHKVGRAGRTSWT
jgi:carbamoyl-phosphate synthase large subunit